MCPRSKTASRSYAAPGTLSPCRCAKCAGTGNLVPMESHARPVLACKKQRMVHSGAMPTWTTEVVDDLVHSTAAALEALCHGPPPQRFSLGRRRASRNRFPTPLKGGKGDKGRQQAKVETDTATRDAPTGHTFQLTPPLTDILADARWTYRPSRLLPVRLTPLTAAVKKVRGKKTNHVRFSVKHVSFLFSMDSVIHGSVRWPTHC